MTTDHPTDREYVLIGFSRELALEDRKTQTEAVSHLWRYVASNPEIAEEGNVDKARKGFDPFFNGKIEGYRAFAEAHGVTFQPEVFRGHVSGNDQAALEQMGFQTFRF
jgi:hypothetical protein